MFGFWMRSTRAFPGSPKLLGGCEILPWHHRNIGIDCTRQFQPVTIAISSQSGAPVNRLPWHILLFNPLTTTISVSGQDEHHFNNWNLNPHMSGASRASLPGSLWTGATRPRWTRRTSLDFFCIDQLEPWNHHQPSSRPISTCWTGLNHPEGAETTPCTVKPAQLVA